jgi:hypothetical protein
MTGAGTAKGTLFTPETANRALPYVRAVVEDLVEAHARLKAAERERRRARSSAASGKADERARDEAARRADEEVARARADMQRIVRELDAVGVEVKEAEIGLLDFPGEMGGRRVLLCWRRGEERVAFWHEESAGFRGRKPIEPADAGSR